MPRTSRRRFLGQSLLASGIALPAAAAETAIHWNRAPLAPNAFAPLPLGAVKPRGWLLSQLRIQASGLSGHLDEFWPDLGPNSAWLGGSGEGWERGPYFLDGVVPLAYLLEDERLIGKTRKWIEWALNNQRPDGAIGPDPKRAKFAHAWQATDWWPNMIMLKVLTQYQEASGDARVVPLLDKYFRQHLREAAATPLVQWAQYRWAEELLAIAWLYNRTGEGYLLELARALHPQSFDWNAHFANFRFPGKITRKDANLSTHVVNNAMALKNSAVWWQFSKNPADRDAIRQMLAMLDRYHLQPNGTHAGDEHYAGRDPSQGTELCAVVEAMFSYEQLLAILGDAAFGDRLERLAYNALPAPFKPDMWAHQYDQQANQVESSVNKSRNWTTNGPDANVFGLEPNFGCCTANMHQGWPKFVSHLWMATRDEGLAAMAYGPSRVESKVRGGVTAAIVADTEYPFRDRVKLTVTPSKEAAFPLHLRIPAWAAGASVSAGGAKLDGVRPGAFFKIERRWKAGDTVEIHFPMALEAERHYRDSVVLRRGPLVFSLKVGERWQKLKGEEPHADWEVYPTTPWNYALDLDPAKPAASVKVEERPVGKMPFSQDGAPVVLTAKARRVPEWTLVNGSAGPLPESPAATTEPVETVTLVPYGSTSLRVTAFPLVKSAAAGAGNWYASSFYLLHQDHHTSGEHAVGRGADPAETARLIALSRPDVIQIHAKGNPGWTTYPSKIGHTPPKLARDVMEVWSGIARRDGYRFSAYYNLGRDGEIMKRRPEWNRVKADGTPYERALCYHSGVAEGYLWPMIAEILERYRPDGFWFDGSWFTVSVCYCAKCAERFRREAGMAPPKDAAAPGWPEYKEMQRRVYREFIHETTRRIKRASPGCLVAVNWAYSQIMPEEAGDAVDYLTGDRASEVDVLSSDAHWYDGQNKPFDLMTTLFVNQGGARPPKPPGQMEQEMGIVVANGGRFFVWDNPTPESGLAAERCEYAGQVIAPFLRARREWCLGSERAPDASLLNSSTAHYAATLASPVVFRRDTAFVESAEALCRRHISFEAVSTGRLKRGDIRSRLLIVDDPAALDPEEIRAVEQWVAGGGRLLVTGSRVDWKFAGAKGVFRCAAKMARTPAEELARLLAEALPPAERLLAVSAPENVEVSLRRKGQNHVVHLVNRAPGKREVAEGAPGSARVRITGIPPVPVTRVSVRLPSRPAAVTIEPGGQRAAGWAYKDGRLEAELPPFAIHQMLAARC